MEDFVQWCHRGYFYNPSFIGNDILSHDVYHISDCDRIVFFCEKQTHKPMSERDFVEFVNFMILSSEVH